MTIDIMSFGNCNWKLAAKLMILGALLSTTNVAKAQEVVPDNTLPQNSVVDNLPNNITEITGGTRAGGNLFHSFEKFGVPTGGEVNFQNALDINNIINRVTGGNISNIDGLIKANGSANFFLINPAGIVFGENARLDIGGSFIGSTADALGFGEDNFFSATDPQNSSSLLSINPNALFFNRINTASIENNSVAESGRNLADNFTARGLRVRDGNSLLLVGGDINIDAGGLYAFGGRVELGGLRGVGTVGLNTDGNNFSLSFPKGVERSDVALRNQGVVDVSGGDGGNIAVNARNLEMTGGSFLFAATDIEQAEDGSRVGNTDVNVTEATDTDVRSQVRGQAGNINISTSTLRLQDGAQVGVSSLSEGNAGDLTVNALDIQLIGGETGFTGLFAQANRGSTGDAGDLTINTNTLLVRDGAEVSTATFGKGKGGNLTLKTNTLLVQNGAFVGAGTFGESRGGNLTVKAEDVQIIGTGNNGNTPSSLGASALANSKGDAGEVNITTKRMLVEDGAFVATSTQGEGNAGNLIINADDLQIIGFGGENPGNDNKPYFSGLYASADEGSTGNAGNLTINTKRMLVEGGALVAANTFSEGDAGNLTITASDVLELIGTGESNEFATGLFARSLENATGDGGNLTVNTKRMLIKDQAQVTVRSLGTGNAGNLNINAADSITLNQGTLSAESETGVGGNINLDINELLLLRNNSLISAISRESGTDGNITINTGFIVAVPSENSDIVAFGEGRTPGSDIVGFDQGLKPGSNIGVNAQGILGIEFRTQRTPESDIVATGEVTLNIEESEPEINSIELPEIPLESRFNDLCEASTGPNPSEFYYFGNGGIPISPWDYLRDESIYVDWVPIPKVTTKVTRGEGDKETRGRVVTQNRIVEATGWIVDQNGDIYFVADASHGTPPSFNNPSCLKKS